MDYEEIWGKQQWVVGRGLEIDGSDEAVEFGGEVWPGALVLAEYLGSSVTTLRNQKVIELGCGCGAVGIVAASLGADVTLTDVSEKNLEVARRNALKNGVEVSTAAIDWRTPLRENSEFDIVVASDVVYAPSLVAPLLCVLREIKHDTLIIANEERSNNQREFGRLLESCDYELVDQVRRDNVLLQRFKLLSLPHKLRRYRDDFYEDESDGLGGCVWPAAQVLADICPRGTKNVLELGAGCGLVGLAAAEHSERVVISDEIVGVAALNARLFANVEMRVLVWGEQLGDDDELETFDLILGAELLQYRDPNLAKEIRRRLVKKGGSSSDGGIAMLTASPCGENTLDDDAVKRCKCATHHFLRKALDEENLVLKSATRHPLHPNAKNAVLGDGLDHTLILELKL